jgi:hypothetical protein
MGWTLSWFSIVCPWLLVGGGVYYFIIANILRTQINRIKVGRCRSGELDPRAWTVLAVSGSIFARMRAECNEVMDL